MKQKMKIVIIVLVLIVAAVVGGIYYELGINPQFLAGVFRAQQAAKQNSDTVVIPGQQLQLSGDRGVHFAGFAKNVYTKGLSQPTSMYFDTDGSLWVAERGGAIKHFFDANSDGIEDLSVNFAEGLEEPLGVLVVGQDVYVSVKHALLKLRDTNKDGKSDEQKIIVGNLPLGRHRNNNLVLGFDGKIYWGQGSQTDRHEFGGAFDPHEASILRVNPDGSNLEVVASGLRNVYDVAVQPTTGELFAVDNGQDVPATGVPDELNLIRAGKKYGWPDCYGSGKGTNCSGPEAPIGLLPEHASADGMTFYNADQTKPAAFPEEYKNNIFIALFGSNSNDPTIGKKIVRVVITGSAPHYTTTISDFATGFNRPLDVAVGPDGALYVADFGSGEIVRIAATYTK